MFWRKSYNLFWKCGIKYLHELVWWILCRLKDFAGVQMCNCWPWFPCAFSRGRYRPDDRDTCRREHETEQEEERGRCDGGSGETDIGKTCMGSLCMRFCNGNKQPKYIARPPIVVLAAHTQKFVEYFISQPKWNHTKILLNVLKVFVLYSM